MRRLVWQTVTIVCLLGIGPAFSMAQTTDSQAIAAAQALVDEAGDLMDAKKYSDACPKLEQAATLLPEGIGVHMALAECYEGLGRLASAQGQYLQAEALAQKAKDSRGREAAKKAAKLKPKLATMTLSVPDEVRNLDGVQLTWDGFVWESALWGTAIPVDIGAHSLEVRAPGWKPWKAEVTVETNGSASKQDVPMLEKLPPEPEKPLPAPKPVVVQSSRTWLYPVGIGLATLGVGAGIGFTIAASSKDAEAADLAEKISFDRNVGESVCPPTSSDSRCSELTTIQSNRNTFTNVAIAGFVVGGAAAIGVAILALTAPSKSPAPKSGKSTLVIVPTTRGVLATGTF